MSKVLFEAINRERDSHFESKDQIPLRQDYASRIHSPKTYPSIPLSIHKFWRLVTGKQRQTYASRRGNLMG